MKIYNTFLAGCLLLAAVACGDDDKTLPEILPAASGTYTDQRDGNEYTWVRYGQLEWMTTNMRFESPDGICQIYSEIQITKEEREAQEKQNCARYGYLYDYEAALAAIPEGWRLPTDKDWQALESLFGLSQHELGQMDWRGDGPGEMLQQPTTLYLRPGGFVDYNEKSLEAPYDPNFIGFYGFFWTSTAIPDETGKEMMLYRQIRYNSGQIGRFSTLPEKLFSVRCVRDVK